MMLGKSVNHATIFQSCVTHTTARKSTFAVDLGSWLKNRCSLI